MQLEKEIESTPSGLHLRNQLIRSGTSPALNYAEAQFAESKRDFIHKIKVVLKELCETRVCLKMIAKMMLCKNSEKLVRVIRESNELVAIFVRSIKTAQNHHSQNK
jgi:four helix bundle protein